MGDYARRLCAVVKEAIRFGCSVCVLFEDPGLKRMPKKAVSTQRNKGPLLKPQFIRWTYPEG